MRSLHSGRGPIADDENGRTRGAILQIGAHPRRGDEFQPKLSASFTTRFLTGTIRRGDCVAVSDRNRPLTRRGSRSCLSNLRRNSTVHDIRKRSGCCIKRYPRLTSLKFTAPCSCPSQAETKTTGRLILCAANTDFVFCC